MDFCIFLYNTMTKKSQVSSQVLTSVYQTTVCYTERIGD